VRTDLPRAFWRLGELTGTTALEDQGRANGTYVGGVTLGVAGSNHDPNTAARFDGGNDRVGVPDPADGSLDFGAGDFTVEAWIRPTSSDERVIVAKRSSLATEPYWGLTVTDDPNHNGQIRANFFDGVATRTAYSLNGVVDGAWHHVVVWFDRDLGITIWVDGTTKFTPLAIAGDVGNTGELKIGKGPTNPYFTGDIDEVALYSGLLPPARAQAHADAA
jgi:Concanavalin A-like lectin/glucanases superfamily